MSHATRILLFVGAVIVVATVALYLLLSDPAARDSVSWLSLALVLAAEALTTGFVAVRQGDAAPGPGARQPLFLARLAVLLLFDLVVVACVVILDWILGVPIRLYLAALVAAAAVLAALFGGLAIIGGHADRLDLRMRAGRGALAALADRLQELEDRLSAGGGPGSQAKLVRDICDLRERLRLSDPVSDPAVAVFESALADKIGELRGAAFSALDAEPRLPDARRLEGMVREAAALLARRNTALRDAK